MIEISDVFGKKMSFEESRVKLFEIRMNFNLHGLVQILQEEHSDV
jgi:hypothetical protein